MATENFLYFPCRITSCVQLNHNAILLCRVIALQILFLNSLYHLSIQCEYSIRDHSYIITRLHYCHNIILNVWMSFSRRFLVFRTLKSNIEPYYASSMDGFSTCIFGQKLRYWKCHVGRSLHDAKSTFLSEGSLTVSSFMLNSSAVF